MLRGSVNRVMRLGDLVGCPECFAETALVPESSGVGVIDFEDVKAAVKEALKPNKLVTALAGMMRKTPNHAAILGRFTGISNALRTPDRGPRGELQSRAT